MKGRAKIALGLGTAAALVASGCGGGDDVDTGPASAVPANTPVYIEATVKPEGEAATDANAALGKILDAADPGAEIVSLLERETAPHLKPGETFTFADDIESWLGEQAGIFFHTFEEGGEPTIVLESTDSQAAFDSFREDTRVTGQTGEYKGHAYEFQEVEGATTVFGEVGEFVVSGPEEGFQQAVDASEGDSLGDSDDFKDSIGDSPDEGLGTLYALPSDFIDALPQDQLDPASRALIEKAAGGALTQPVLGSVTASAEDIQIELSAGNNGVETEQSSLLEQLPASSWLAIGFGNLGDAVDQGLENVQDAEIPGADLETIRSQVQIATGLELDQITGALGNGAIFVEGTNQASLAGALVIQTDDPETTSTLLTKLQTLIQQSDPREAQVQPLASATGEVGFQVVDKTGELKQPVQFVQQGDKVVIGYGSNSVAQALGQSGGAVGGTLSTTPAFASAAGKLENLGVDFFLSFAPVFQLAESEGANQDPDYVEAKPYIDALDYVAFGSGDEDDRALLRFIVGLK